MPLPSHEELVRQLLQPRAYPEKVTQLRLLQTHISSLFFTGEHAYKVKRPVSFGFLDFTTLAKRRYYCRQEVALNRRLSPEVYLGVVEINEQNGRLVINGPGRTVEYAVKMRQLPAERALDALVRRGAVAVQDIRSLGERVADFHSRARTGSAIARQGGLAAVLKNVRENFRQTRRYVGLCVTQEAYDNLLAYSQAFLDAHQETFHLRAAQGRIRDCHGDLQAATIFLVNGIHILDCIEFNRRFRYGDVASEVAFLAMDLDFHGRPDLSETFVQGYVQASGDAGLRKLLDFFKSYRAYVRAKVTSFRLDDPALPPKVRQETLATAQAYYSLAHSYTRVIPQPSLFLVAGLPGTGKSTVAQELAQRQSAAYLSSDLIRKNLAGIGSTEHRYEPFAQGIYAPDVSRQTYAAMLSQARGHLANGHSVVLDATFRSSRERLLAKEVAQDAGAELWIVECTAPVEEVQRRLKRRLQDPSAVSDARWELFQQQAVEWEQVREAAPGRHLRLDTGGSRRRVLLELLHQLYASALRSQPSPP